MPDIYINNFTQRKDLYIVIAYGKKYITANIGCGKNEKPNMPTKFTIDEDIDGFYLYAVTTDAWMGKAYYEIVNPNRTEILIGINGSIADCSSETKSIDINYLNLANVHIMDLQYSTTLRIVDAIILRNDGIVVDGITYKLVGYDPSNVVVSDDTVTVGDITYGKLQTSTVNIALILVFIFIIFLLYTIVVAATAIWINSKK